MIEQGNKSRKSALSRAIGAGLGASLFCAAFALTAHDAAFAKEPEAKRAPSTLEQRTRFTPARGDARLAASLSRGRGAARSFSFTPANTERKRDDVQVVVRGESDVQSRRIAASAETREVAGSPSVMRFTPASYNLGVDVGWKRFAVSGDVSQQRSNVPSLADKDRAQVGLSYNRDSFSTRVAVSGERNSTLVPSLSPRESYSLDVGGKINISKHIAVTGGVRYRIDQDRIDPALSDNRRDSQAVYVGTNLRF